jgi:hypothetical protein
MPTVAHRSPVPEVQSVDSPGEVAMKRVQDRIAVRQAELAGHTFFRYLLREDLALEVALRWTPSVAFWSLAFQDVLRLNGERVTDPKMIPIVRHHLVEDSGHDLWYLEDLTALGFKHPGLAELFDCRGPSRATRDSAYQVVSEVYRCNDDRLRVNLLLALEGAGHVFFGGVTSMVDRLGGTKRLKYFSRYHLEVEKDHDLFKAEGGDAEDVAAIELTPELEREALLQVDRVFEAVALMLSGFVLEIEAPPPAKTPG